ncbi:hypothetical protein HNQ53_003348 [Microbulbifer hydrolyticus]|uniref:Uncharacterized protein n=1 Tax=Microbulbifer hydrolyticus TaxID=48074 RepID=A0AA89PXC2_9GAMM|nr:hypothetical protein [Microbulbifer hydrolyticus]
MATATVVACATNSEQFPEKKIYDLSLSASIETASGSESKVIPVQCVYVDRSCGGGDWYFKWSQKVEEGLFFKLNKGKSLVFETPSCSTLLEFLGKEYPYGGSNIISNGESFSIGNANLSKNQAKSVFGVRLLNFSITEKNDPPNL